MEVDKLMDFHRSDTTKDIPAMAYVPWQELHTTYDPEKALRRGTIFPELDKPFTGRHGGDVWNSN